MIRRFLVFAVLLAPTAGRAADPLTYVPPDAAMFVHVDIAKLMASPFGKSLREIELPSDQTEFDVAPGQTASKTVKPYADLRKKFQAETGIDFETIVSATLYIPKLKGPGDEATTVLALVLKGDYDQAKLLKGLAAFDEQYASPKAIGPGLVEFRPGGMRMGFPDARTVLVMGGQVKELPKAVANASGVLAPAIAAAKAGRTGVWALNFANFPEEIKGDDLPNEVRPFAPLIKSDLSYATFDLDGDTLNVAVRVHNADATKTADAERSLDALTKFAKTGLAVAETQLEPMTKNEPGMAAILGLVKSLRDATKTIRFASTETEATMSFAMKADANLAVSGVLLATRTTSISSRSVVSNNLKQVGLALHNYESAYGHLPAAAICGKDGKPLLSWRVAILPYIEQDNLYKQFKLDEAWDSPHNIKLADYVVKVYTLPGQSDSKKTHLRVFTGGDGKAAFDLKNPFKIVDFTDGTSNTICTVYAKEPVIWTKPDELVLDLKKNPADQLRFQNDITVVGFMDVSVRAMTKSVPAETWRALMTRNGGEVVSIP